MIDFLKRSGENLIEEMGMVGASLFVAFTLLGIMYVLAALIADLSK